MSSCPSRHSLQFTLSAFPDRIRPPRACGVAPLRFGKEAEERLLWSACPPGPAVSGGTASRLPVKSLGSEQPALPARPAAHRTQKRPRRRHRSPPRCKCVPATQDGKRHQNLRGTSTELLSPNKELTSAGNVKMLFRTSVLRCLTQRRDCCAREQSDPVFTKQGFSHCTFCFQNTQDHSKFSSWGKDATSGSERGDNRNLSQRS